jgi:hypothetical protein
MHNFTSVVGQLGCFVGGYDGEKAGGRYLAWVGSEDSIDFFPDLQLGSLEAYC